jgi:hypothetical protein
MEVFIDERYLDSRILGTTWSQLKEQSLVRQANNSRWLYTLSGYGLLHGLKMRGEFDTEETRQKTGKLAAALKRRIKSVNRECDQFADVGELTTETGLSQEFIRNAIEASFIEELFGTRGAEWDSSGRGRSIRIPNQFGHER